MSALQGCPLCPVENSLYTCLKTLSISRYCITDWCTKDFVSWGQTYAFFLMSCYHSARISGHESYSKSRHFFTLFLILYGTATWSPSADTLNCSLLQGDNLTHYRRLESLNGVCSFPKASLILLKFVGLASLGSVQQWSFSSSLQH